MKRCVVCDSEWMIVYKTIWSITRKNEVKVPLCGRCFNKTTGKKPEISEQSLKIFAASKGVL
jgi:hypothetical protein